MSSTSTIATSRTSSARADAWYATGPIYQPEQRRSESARRLAIRAAGGIASRLVDSPHLTVDIRAKCLDTGGAQTYDCAQWQASQYGERSQPDRACGAPAADIVS